MKYMDLVMVTSIIVVVLVIVLFATSCITSEDKKERKLIEPMENTNNQARTFQGQDPMHNSEDWQEVLADGLEPRLKEDQKKFIENVRRFGGSAVRNFVIDEMATNQAFTNWKGLKGAPKYVPVRASSREQPSYNTEFLKTIPRHLIG